MKKKIFNQQKMIIGMLHVPALPGTPRHSASIDRIIEISLEEANIYEKSGIDSMIIENMHDVPYLNKNVGPEITASMTAIACEIKRHLQIPIGIQILAGANKQALAVAKAAGLDFIRAEGFLYSHIADEGLMNADAGELLRYRKQIEAESIFILADIKKKHSSHSITDDISILEFASAAEFFLSDGIIVTGSATGKPADIMEIKELKNKINLPVYIGSGITIDNISEYWYYADGFIVGSHFKENGDWKNPVSEKRIVMFMEKIRSLT